MGQYWKPVCIERREYIDPHALGSGLKLWEQLANSPGVGGALTILLAAMPEARGGGDFDKTENWHGPERKFPEHNVSPGPMPSSYPKIAGQTIGRWAGCRVALIGDYAEPGDISETSGATYDGIPEDVLYHLCTEPDDFDIEHLRERLRARPEAWKAIGAEQARPFRDITPLVAAVIEHELGGKFVGDGWREFKRTGT